MKLLDKKPAQFFLNPDCFLVKGAKRGALYDLASGHVFSVDEDSVKILDECEKGVPISRIAGDSSKSLEEIYGHLEALEALKLGKFHDACHKINKIELPLSGEKLVFVWLELTQECNLRCLHCYTGSDSHACCGRRDQLTLAQWEKIISDASAEGCRKLQLIGGEPMLFGKDIFVLIRLARELGYELIEIFTNATLLTDEDIGLLEKYNVQVATSVYSKREEIHDRITSRKGSFQKTIGNVMRLKSRGVRVRFATIAMRQNEEYLAETIDFLKDLGEVSPLKSCDVVRPVGRGRDKKTLSPRLSAWLCKSSPVFPKVAKEDFARRMRGHDCWQGKIAVKSNGDIIPCIMARETVCGNIKNQPLAGILENEKLRYLRSLSKDKIEICKDCEYRYACIDCRPLAESLCAQDKKCLYDPYEGKWQKKEDKNGG